jgi:transcriptional antiterminator NusG
MASHWYIVQALSGFEHKVAQTIQEKATQHNLTGFIEEVTVPTEEVVEMKRGKKVTAERKFFPGYVLVKMELNDATWHMVKNIPRVTGFLGGQGRPQPMSEGEVKRLFKRIEEGAEQTKNAVLFEVGETVKVNDGPFESFVGVVEDVDGEKGRLKLSVSIFGRATPVELEFTQVEKVA